jgi:uncharacterized delta-60 repeat protein
MKKLLLFVAILISFFESRSQNGELDKSFGHDGLVETVLKGDGNIMAADARKCFLGPDGKILVVLELAPAVIVNRRFSDGRIDSSYGKNGFSAFVNMNQPTAAIQQDGKIILAGSTSGVNSDFMIARINSNGKLDETFGNAGVSITDGGSDNDALNSVVVANDGKIIAGGQSYRNGISQFALIRYNSNGTPDPTFGTNAIVITNFGNSANINALTLDSNNNIIAAGNFFDGTKGNFALAMYKGDGTLDSGFNVDGQLVSNFGNSDNAIALTVQNNGRIVVGGYYTDASSNSHFEIVRYTSAGLLDPSFNGTGLATVNFGNAQDFLSAIEIQNNGKIIAGGYTYVNGSTNLALARLTSEGTLDLSFGNAGLVTTDIDSSMDILNCLLLQPDGKIIAGGLSEIGSNQDFIITRYAVNGILDDKFGAAGKLIGYYPEKEIGYSEGMLQPDGKIIVSGQTYDGVTVQNFLSRFKPNGSIDPYYGQHGTAFTNGFFSAIQPDGKVVESGFLNGPDGEGILINRYTITGTLDSSYGKNGAVVYNFSGGGGFEGPCAVQSNSKLIISGSINNNVGSDLVLARYNQDGSPDLSFGNGGQVITDFETYDMAQAIAVDKNGRVLVSGVGYTPTFELVFIAGLFKNNGTLDSSFAQEGKLIITGGMEAFATQLAFQKDGKILLGYESSPDFTNFTNHINRYQNGQPDASFGQNGSITSIGSGIFLEGDQKILVSGTTVNLQNKEDFDLSRYNENGSLDHSFGNSGQIISDFTQGDDILSADAMNGNQLYVVGYAMDPNQVGLLAKYLIKESAKLTVPANITIPTDANSCSAIVNKIDPELENFDDSIAIGYLLSGATVGSGKGTASGLAFNRGLTFIKYFDFGDSTISAAFSINVQDGEAPEISNITTSLSGQLKSDQQQDVGINYTVKDNCGVLQNGISITDYQAESSPTDFIKSTGDWQVMDDHHVRLRTGMRYEIQVFSEDSSGNRTIKNTSVLIPATIGNGLNDLIITSLPNPTNSSFGIRSEFIASRGNLSLQLFNDQGRLIQTIPDLPPGKTIQIGLTLIPGLYFLKAIQSGNIRTIKLIKF